jgi:hypothetical protein
MRCRYVKILLTFFISALQENPGLLLWRVFLQPHSQYLALPAVLNCYEMELSLSVRQDKESRLTDNNYDKVHKVCLGNTTLNYSSLKCTHVIIAFSSNPVCC